MAAVSPSTIEVKKLSYVYLKQRNGLLCSSFRICISVFWVVWLSCTLQGFTQCC